MNMNSVCVCVWVRPSVFEENNKIHVKKTTSIGSNQNEANAEKTKIYWNYRQQQQKPENSVELENKARLPAINWVVVAIYCLVLRRNSESFRIGHRVGFEKISFENISGKILDSLAFYDCR